MIRLNEEDSSSDFSDHSNPDIYSELTTKPAVSKKKAQTEVDQDV